MGMRSYARGRAYDPDRYPVTPYLDPDGKDNRSTIDPTFGGESEPVEPPAEELLPENTAPVSEPVETSEQTPVPETAPVPEDATSPEDAAEESPEEPAAPATADEMFEQLRQETGETAEDDDSPEE